MINAPALLSIGLSSFAAGWIASRIGSYRKVDPFLYEKFIFPSEYLHGRLLDIGSGRGADVELMRALAGVVHVQPLDIVDRAKSKDVQPVLFDGKTIPYGRGEFDASTLFFVLHHSADARALILEALRVSGVCIIGEDLPETPIDQLLCAAHLATSGWARGNQFRTDAKWLQLFHQLGLRVLDSMYIGRSRYYSYPVRRAFYVVAAAGVAAHT